MCARFVMPHESVALEVNVRCRSTNDRSKYKYVFWLVIKADSSQLVVVANCSLENTTKQKERGKGE